ncbi:oxidoreductase [Pseudoxanthomonas koreensis]|uniref:oxidoreductase n=1 Tax=Pseudoxanthomonas koreensis TaxID=266061 RepID=UPI0035A5D3C2
MPATVNVALLGYGLAGRVFHAPLVSATAGMRLHTVVSRNPDAVSARHPQARVLPHPEPAFADPQVDLVVVATPNHSHAPLALAALAAGKHVVVDKPFALDAGQAQEMIAAAARTGRMLSVFHNRRWDADFLALRALVQSGALGEVVELHSHFDRFRPQVPDRWRDREGPGSGLWYDLGPHLVDQALQLFGQPLAVHADLGRQRQGASAVDWFHVCLRYRRLRVLLHAGSLVPAHGLRFAAHGTGGSWIKYGLDPQEDALRAGAVPGGPDWGADPWPGTLVQVDSTGTVREALAGSPHGDYPAYYAQLRDALLDGAPAPVSAHDALLTMQVIDAGLASAGQRREVGLPGGD